MKLLVLGATGGTGLEIIQQAVNEGHSVTAFVRSSAGLARFSGQITVMEGELLNSYDLERAIQGQDAILSGFGPRTPVSKADAKLLETYASALTGAMARSGVRRVVIVSTAFLFKDAVVPPAHLIGRLFFAGVMSDAAAMERIVCGSDLDWTIVRPPRLTDAALTEKYRVRVGHLPRFGFKASRADVANCVLKCVEDNSSIRMILGVSN